MYVCMYVCMYVSKNVCMYEVSSLISVDNHHVCMYVCMYVAQLVRVCSWRSVTSRTFGLEFECGRATYIKFLGQGTNIQLPLSPECQFCPASMKYEVQQV